MADGRDPGPPEARELIARLPRTMAPAFHDQLAQWELLFPAERRQLRAQLAALSQKNDAQWKALFAPILALEAKMELPNWTGISVRDAGLLARSPLYPEWRQEVGRIFSRLDEATPAPAIPRLVACILPEGLPPAESPWKELSKQGTWIQLDAPFASLAAGLTEMVAARRRRPGVEEIESTWIFECDSRYARLAEAPGVVDLDWVALAPARREFLKSLNTIRRDLKSVDDTHSDLRRANIARLLPAAAGGRPQVREFVRSVFLSGNGSLVFPNSFVQWGAAEALRRVQPQALFACFGVRKRLKPFSSAVLFEDQNRNNPTADSDDPAGSLVDALMLAEYVYLAAQRSAVYAANTVGLLAVGGLDRVLLLGVPPDGMTGSMRAARFREVLAGWLGSGL